MSMYAYDINGYVGDVGTNTGWKSLCDFFQDSDSEQLKSLAKNGWSDGIDFSSVQAPKGKVLEGLFENFKQVVVKCEEILIVSNGIEQEAGEDGYEQ